MYNKNMTIAELRDEITNQIQARFDNPIRSICVYAGDKNTTPFMDPYHVKSHVIQPILNDVLDGVPFIVDLQTSDRDQIRFQMRQFDNEGMPFNPMSDIIPSCVFKIRRKKHSSSGRIIPYAVDVCDFCGDALPAEVVDKPVREYIIAITNEAFACHLSGNLEKMCRYMNAVLYFRAHGITDVDELGSMTCDISRNHSAWVSSTGLILTAPKEFDGDKKYEWMPKTREVPFVMADEVFARTIDTLEASGRMELLRPDVVQKLRDMRPKLAEPFQKSAYCILKAGAGYMPENWLPAMVGYSGNKENMEDLYMKAVFLQTPYTRMYNIGFTEKYAASDDEVKAISNPGRWYAYNYGTGVITSGEFTSSADIPALDNNMIYLVEGERVGF